MKVAGYHPIQSAAFDQQRELTPARSKTATDEAPVKGLKKPAPDALTETAATSQALRRVEVQVNESTGRIQVKILDRKTGQVVREVPPEELERFAEAMREYLGRLMDRRV